MEEYKGYPAYIRAAAEELGLDEEVARAALRPPGLGVLDGMAVALIRQVDPSRRPGLREELERRRDALRVCRRAAELLVDHASALGRVGPASATPPSGPAAPEVEVEVGRDEAEAGELEEGPGQVGDVESRSGPIEADGEAPDARSPDAHGPEARPRRKARKS